MNKLVKKATVKNMGILTVVGLVSYAGYKYFEEEEEETVYKKTVIDEEKKEVRSRKYQKKEGKVLRKKTKLTKKDKEIIFQISRKKDYYTDRLTGKKVEITKFMRIKYKLWSVVVGENGREGFKFLG